MKIGSSIFAALLALPALGVLSGCATEETPPPETTAQTTTASDTTETASLPAPDEKAPAQPATAPAVPEEPVPALETLQGLDSVAVTALLGQPQFQRVDNPAELWQYRKNGCVLDLFLYPATNGALAVDHLETRHFKDSENDAQSCFAAIVRAARKTS